MEFLERNGNVQRLAKAGTKLDDRIMKQLFGQLVQTIVEKDKKYNVTALLEVACSFKNRILRKTP